MRSTTLRYFGTFTTPGRVIQVDLLAGPPEILSAAGRDGTVHAGQITTFAVVFTDRNLTYQWQRGGVPIPGATSEYGYSFTTAATDDGATFNLRGEPTPTARRSPAKFN